MENNLITNNDYEIYYNNLIWPYGCIILLIGFVFIIFFYFLKHNFGVSATFTSIKQRTKYIENSVNPNRLLGLLAILFGLNLISVFNMFYLLQVIALSFSFAPIVFGLLYELTNKRIKWLWFLIMILTFFFHIVQGSRGNSVLPWLLFFIGYIINTKNVKNRNGLFITLMFMAYPLIVVFGRISDYRKIFGRGLEVTTENFFVLTDFMVRGSSSAMIESSAPEGLVRLLNHPDMAVINLTPSYVGFRGFNFIIEELQNVMSINATSLRGGDFYDGNYGISVVTKYGYSCNESTSSEFSLLADSYSRGGFVGVIIYYSFFVVLIFSLERIMVFSMRRNSFIALTLLMFILISSINILYSNTIWEFVRTIIYRGTVIFLILYFCSIKLSCKT